MIEIGKTEALEAYLKLQKENDNLREENNRLTLKFEEYRKAWGSISVGVNTLFNWLGDQEKTKTIRRKMAEIFKFAYMENQFEDMRAKWAINQNQTVETEKLKDGEK